MSDPTKDSVVDSILSTWRRMFDGATKGGVVPPRVCGRQHIFEDLIAKRLVELGMDSKVAIIWAIEATCDVMAQEKVGTPVLVRVYWWNPSMPADGYHLDPVNGVIHAVNKETPVFVGGFNNNPTTYSVIAFVPAKTVRTKLDLDDRSVTAQAFRLVTPILVEGALWFSGNPISPPKQTYITPA